MKAADKTKGLNCEIESPRQPSRDMHGKLVAQRAVEEPDDFDQDPKLMKYGSRGDIDYLGDWRDFRKDILKELEPNRITEWLASAALHAKDLKINRLDKHPELLLKGVLYWWLQANKFGVTLARIQAQMLENHDKYPKETAHKVARFIEGGTAAKRYFESEPFPKPIELWDFASACAQLANCFDTGQVTAGQAGRGSTDLIIRAALKSNFLESIEPHYSQNRALSPAIRYSLAIIMHKCGAGLLKCAYSNFNLIDDAATLAQPVDGERHLELEKMLEDALAHYTLKEIIEIGECN